MAKDPIKVVRARRVRTDKSIIGESYGELDLKISIYKAGVVGNLRRVEATDSLGNKAKDPLEWNSATGKYSKYTDDEFIRLYLDTVAKLEGFESEVTNIDTGLKGSLYEIIQDPWTQDAPKRRRFGYDPYCMNNGCKIIISWWRRTKKDTPVPKGKASFPYFWDEDEIFIEEGGLAFSDDKGHELTGEVSKKNELGQDVLVQTSSINKFIEILTPDGNSYGLILTDDKPDQHISSPYQDRLRFIESKKIDSDPELAKKEWFESWTDWNMLTTMKDAWWSTLRRNNWLPTSGYYDVYPCEPSYDKCDPNKRQNQILEFIDPIYGPQKPKPPEKKIEEEKKEIKASDDSKTNATNTKVLLSFKFPDDFKAVQNKDMPPFKVFVGDIPKEELNSAYTPVEELQDDELTEEDVLDPEYYESSTPLGENINDQDVVEENLRIGKQNEQNGSDSNVNDTGNNGTTGTTGTTTTTTTTTTSTSVSTSVTTSTSSTSSTSVNEIVIEEEDNGKDIPKSTGEYTSVRVSESTKGSTSKNYGFNKVPYYNQYDSRWADVIYGKSKEGKFMEAYYTRNSAAKGISVWQILADKAGKLGGRGEWYDFDKDGKIGGPFKFLLDPRKGNLGWSTIAGGGCGITSLAMGISYWAGEGKCKFTNPVKTAKLSVFSGARTNMGNNTDDGRAAALAARKVGKNSRGNDVESVPPSVCIANGSSYSGGLIKAVKKEFGLILENIKNDANAETTVRAYLKKKIPVIVGVNGSTKTALNENGGAAAIYEGGHYVIFTGIDSDGDIRVNDPGNYAAKGITHFKKWTTFNHFHVLKPPGDDYVV